MESKIATPEVPYEGLQKQILSHYRARERRKACNVVVKEHIGQNGATYANVDELLLRAIQIGALIEIGTIREKMGEFGEGY